MRTAEEWIDIPLNDPSRQSIIDVIKEIQLDARKQGMVDARNIIANDGCCADIWDAIKDLK